MSEAHRLQVLGCHKVIHALEPMPGRPAPVVYLAGPVSRDTGVLDWHEDAVEELRAVGYRDQIVVPCLRPGRRPDSSEQVAWEHSAMSRADALLFWIPRVLWTLPGLTTNLEWGIWHDSGKAILGAPPGAPRMRYLRFYADRAGAPQTESLHDAARIAADIATRAPSGR